MKPHSLAHPALLLNPSGRRITSRVTRFVVDRFLLLPLGAAIALLWANAAPESYFAFAHAIGFAVNEIAMALFLALIAQEVLEALMPGGALHTWRRWILPIVAATGGVAGAAGVYLLYVSLKYELVLAQAWPVACAIDVAACYYVLKFVGLRGAVLAFALLIGCITDAFGLLCIALQPPINPIHPWAVVLLAAALATAEGLRRSKVREFWPYFAVSGTLSWFALWMQGIHPALALVPIVPFLPRAPRSIDMFADPHVDTPVHRSEHEWNEAVQVVLFLFGLVNAGVVLRAYGTGTWAILAAALVGRPVGIVTAIALAGWFGLRPPHGVGRRELLAIALATSSGFTFALFLAPSLIATGPVLAEIKLGALATAAGAAAVIGVRRISPSRAEHRHVPGELSWHSR
jgi:NhaA family Na+:H+ antiporter